MNSSSLFEDITCNLCGEKAAINKFTATDWLSEKYERFNIVRCNSCGLVYINPRPKQADIYKYYYPAEYYTHKTNVIQKLSSTQPNIIHKVKEIIKKVYCCYFYPERNTNSGYLYRILGFILLLISRKQIYTKGRWGMIGEEGKLLDVGCGNGAYLYAIKNDWLIGKKIECVGIDVDSKAVENAMNTGIDARVADSENIPFRVNFFDIVTMRHSLEHMPNPSKTLKEIYRVIKPGGKIIIEVPNVESIGVKLLKDKWAGLDAPRHLYHFSLGTLKKMLIKAGFRVTKLHKWQGTFHKDISLSRMEKFWEYKGLNNYQKKLGLFLLRFLLSIIDYGYRGGCISIEAYKLLS